MLRYREPTDAQRARMQLLTTALSGRLLLEARGGAVEAGLWAAGSAVEDAEDAQQDARRYMRRVAAAESFTADPITRAKLHVIEHAVHVGMAQRDENFAWHYGTEAQRQLYGERLKHVFFVQERGWMRSVVHRGLTVFKQALRAADGHV